MLNLALYLFQNNRLTFGQSARLLGISQSEFQKELGKHHIPIHYDISDFRDDLKTLKQVGML